MICLKAVLIALCLPRVSTVKFTLGNSYFRIGIADLTGVTSVTFDVKTCETIHLLLCDVSSSFESVIAYRCTVGENFSEVRRHNGRFRPELRYVQTPNILDCRSFRAFWISWDGGYLQLGKGRDIGKETILMHSIDHNITSVLKVLEVSGIGEWDISPSNQARRHAFFRKLPPFVDPIAEMLADLTTQGNEHCAYECLSNLRCNSYNIDQIPEKGLYRCQLKATYFGSARPQASTFHVDRWEMVYN